MKIIKILTEKAEKIGEVYYAEEIRCFVKVVEIEDYCCSKCPGLILRECILESKCGIFTFIKIDKFE